MNNKVGYDRRVRPDYGGEPVSVGVTLYVLSVSEISEKFMDFTFDMYFRSEFSSVSRKVFKNSTLFLDNSGRTADWALI